MVDEVRNSVSSETPSRGAVWCQRLQYVAALVVSVALAVGFWHLATYAGLLSEKTSNLGVLIGTRSLEVVAIAGAVGSVMAAIVSCALIFIADGKKARPLSDKEFEQSLKVKAEQDRYEGGMRESLLEGHQGAGQ